VFFAPLQQIAKILGFGPASKVSEKKNIQSGKRSLSAPRKKIQGTFFGVGGCLMGLHHASKNADS